MTLEYAYPGPAKRVAAASVVLVTTLAPEDGLYHALVAQEAAWADHGVRKVTRVGDCYGPATIAQAVWSGHRYGRTLGEPESVNDEVPFKRELLELSRQF